MWTPWEQDVELSGPMALRTAVIYLAALVMVRLGNRRFMARMSAFDVVVAIVLGSTLSRAINGGAALIPSLVAAAALLVLHWALAALAFYWPPFARLIEGRSRVLVRDGQPRWDELRKSHIPEADLRSAVRMSGHVAELEEVSVARLESDGKISVIPRRAEVRVLEVSVAEGVQTVRIEISPERPGGDGVVEGSEGG